MSYILHLIHLMYFYLFYLILGRVMLNSTQTFGLQNMSRVELLLLSEHSHFSSTRQAVTD